MTRATVVVPVLPVEVHLRGLVDLISALSRYERDTSVVAVCDGPTEAVEAVAARTDIPVDVIAHPRAGRGNGLLGGACTGTLAGLAHAAARGKHLVLKVDCDALLIASCFEELERLFAERPNAGIAGALRSGDETAVVARAARRLAEPVVILRRPPPGQRRVVPLLAGPRRRAAGFVKRAKAAGWEAGVHCQGGAYAVSPGLMEALDRAGVLDHPLDWVDLPLNEDGMMAALAVSLGFHLLDASGPGEPFGVDFRRLPAPAPEMVERGHALIHSLKSDPDGRSESELREYFAALRHAD
jgi:hypothetical protein